VKLNVIEGAPRSAPSWSRIRSTRGALAAELRQSSRDDLHADHLWPVGVCEHRADREDAFLVLGIMALFNATLTLPGIAGFVLAIGAACRRQRLALINEARSGKEIRRGRKILDAVETGYRGSLPRDFST
jgi:hypothetical protein